MNTIRPISDLKDHFDEITAIIHNTNQPVFLSEQGNDDIVVMSMEYYKNLAVDINLHLKLSEAEKNYKETTIRYTSADILNGMKAAARGQ